ncbi:MAG: hypothetical protein ABFS24_01490 [Pseudomonadota bacterium]
MHFSHSKRLSYFLICFLALSNILFSPNAMAAGYNSTAPSGGAMLADTVLVRPLMLTGTVVGLATFIVTSPFSLLGGNIGEAGKKLVVEPAAYTFVRPLGEL